MWHQPTVCSLLWQSWSPWSASWQPLLSSFWRGRHCFAFSLTTRRARWRNSGSVWFKKKKTPHYLTPWQTMKEKNKKARHSIFICRVPFKLLCNSKRFAETQRSNGRLKTVIERLSHSDKRTEKQLNTSTFLQCGINKEVTHHM